MARYSEEILNEVRQSNDIVDVISQYVHLKRSGRNFFGLCPFHNEKSPSFSVSPDKQIFHCFGCGVGGNVITFVSQIEGLNFVETSADRCRRRCAFEVLWGTGPLGRPQIPAPGPFVQTGLSAPARQGSPHARRI